MTKKELITDVYNLLKYAEDDYNLDVIPYFCEQKESGEEPHCEFHMMFSWLKGLHFAWDSPITIDSGTRYYHSITSATTWYEAKEDIWVLLTEVIEAEELTEIQERDIVKLRI